jgi:phage terminase small subunit
LPTSAIRHSGQTPNRPSRTLRSTDRNNSQQKNPQQQATDWLSGVAEENDDVKDIIMQELMGREDFQNA